MPSTSRVQVATSTLLLFFTVNLTPLSCCELAPETPFEDARSTLSKVNFVEVFRISPLTSAPSALDASAAALSLGFVGQNPSTDPAFSVTR